MTTRRANPSSKPTANTPENFPHALRALPGVDWAAILPRLAEPFEAQQVQYRVGAIGNDKRTAQALPYADPRVYEDRLDTVCPGAWSVSFTPWGEHRIICHLTIHGVTRSSTGEEGGSPDDIAGTAAEAQAFKRACSKFGLGRYLYSLPARWLPYDPTRKRFEQARDRTGEGATNSADGIGVTRAQRMRAHLIQLNIPAANHLKLASDALARSVTDLATITEDEARAVWSLASRRNTEYGAPRHVPQRRK